MVNKCATWTSAHYPVFQIEHHITKKNQDTLLATTNYYTAGTNDDNIEYFLTNVTILHLHFVQDPFTLNVKP